jgi:ketosteroid isomerase-like protein
MHLSVAARPAQPTQPVPSADEQAAQRTVLDLYAAARDQDADRYRALCTDDFVLVERGQAADVERSLAAFVRSPRVRKARIEFSATRIAGSTALLVYQLTSDIDGGATTEQRRWIESATLVKSGSDWKVSAIRSTPIGAPSHSVPQPPTRLR